MDKNKFKDLVSVNDGTFTCCGKDYYFESTSFDDYKITDAETGKTAAFSNFEELLSKYIVDGKPLFDRLTDITDW